jgi:uncharacterized protein involved in exopolysaccharide biosynthesis
MQFSQTKMLGLVLLLIGLALICLGLSSLLGTPQFQATARIKVEPEPVFDASGQSETAYDPYFIQTTFEIIQSEVILSNVVSTLNLETLWGKKFAGGKKLSLADAMDLLKQRLILAPVRNTKIIAINVRSDDPVEAANIANAIVDAYIHYREETRKQILAKGLEVLQQQYNETAQKIEAMQTNLDSLRKQYGISLQDESVVDSTSTLSERTTPAEREKALNEYNRTKPFWDAKFKLKELNDQHQLFRAKLEAIRLNDSIPKNSMVLPVDFATPPKSPIGPNRFLGTVMLALGLITALGGWLLLMSEREVT